MNDNVPCFERPASAYVPFGRAVPPEQGSGAGDAGEV
jgi:hypothetical protein